MMKYTIKFKKHPELLNNENTPFHMLLNEGEISTWQKKRKIQLQDQSYPFDWSEIGVVFNDPYIIIFRDLVEFPDSGRGGYIRIYNRAYLEGGAAGVVAMPVKDGKILLMHNFRHATRSWHWEIPRGFGEPGVSAENQARVEMKEEIGVEVAELVDLGIYYNNTGLEGNPINLFLARIAEGGIVNPDIGVDTLRWVSVEEMEKLIANAEITDGFTIATFTRAKLKCVI